MLTDEYAGDLFRKDSLRRLKSKFHSVQETQSDISSLKTPLSSRGKRSHSPSSNSPSNYSELEKTNSEIVESDPELLSKTDNKWVSFTSKVNLLLFNLQNNIYLYKQNLKSEKLPILWNFLFFPKNIVILISLVDCFLLLSSRKFRQISITTKNLPSLYHCWNVTITIELLVTNSKIYWDIAWFVKS